MTPLYAGVRERFPDIRSAEIKLELPLGAERHAGTVWTLNPSPNLTIYFLDQPAFFERETLYQKEGLDYPDNPARFLFFSKAIAHLAFTLPWGPEVIHLHDWQSAFAAVFIRHQRRMAGWLTGPKVCTTIHNLAYQGASSVRDR